MSLLNKLKNYQKLNPKKLFETFMTVTVVSLVTMGAVYDSDIKEITVMRTDAFASTLDIVKTKTRQSNVYDFLEEKGIVIEDDEILKADISGELEDGEILQIKQGRYIVVSYDGNTRRILTSKANVADALLENGIEIGENDWVEPSFEAPVVEDMRVTLRRIGVREETVTEEILSPIETRTDDNMYEDEKIILEQGTNGKKDVTYRVMYEDGVEVHREPVKENILVEPTKTIEVVGTKPARTVTKQGKTFKYARKLTVKATAYDTSLEENGGYTKTAMGLTPGYGIVAVDPRVIPLGTKLYIESTDDGQSWTYGYCIAGDTGGAIKGNRVDLCYYTQAECIRFGRRNATVYVIE